MKTEILQILQMQKDGKLTQEQAAELLAALADQAPEKSGATPNSGAAGAQPEPVGTASQKKDGKDGADGVDRSFSRSAAAAMHTFVDTAVGVGATVSRAATVWGGGLVGMVHREQSGNSITLSKVDPPSGEQFQFSSNTFNVSKVSDISLHAAEFSNNAVNASKVSHVEVTRGRMSQCGISGSSVSHITIEGKAAAERVEEVVSSLRGVTLNATKFGRVKILAGSQVEASSFLACTLKDMEVGNGSVVRDSKFNDAALSAVRFDHATITGLAVERSHVHSVVVTDMMMNQVGFHGTRVSDCTLTKGVWTNTRFRRDVAGTGAGGRDSSLTETTIDSCTLTDCNFLGCVFRRTTLRNLNLSGLTIRNVDFTGMTLEDEGAFRRRRGCKHEVLDRVAVLTENAEHRFSQIQRDGRRL